MGLKAADNCRPIAKICNAREEEIAGSSEEIARQSDYKEIERCGAVATRVTQEQPKDCRESKVDDRPARRNPPGGDIALQGDRTYGQTMCAAEPSRNAMAQAFVQHVLNDIRWVDPGLEQTAQADFDHVPQPGTVPFEQRIPGPVVTGAKEGVVGADGDPGENLGIRAACVVETGGAWVGAASEGAGP